MIEFSNQVPSVYTRASRDFQYISWLVDVVLNSVKHNVDDLYSLPNVHADPKLTELLAMTLGFKVKRNYNQQQLTALVSVVPYILKFKGTKKALELACIALIKASGSSGIFVISYIQEEHCVEVLLPENLVDTVLFTDLLPYILPAGITARVVTKTVLDPGIESVDLAYEDSLEGAWKRDLKWDEASGRITGLSASMFEDSFSTENKTVKPNFAYFDEHNYKKPNVGLLDNNIIAEVGSAIKDTRDYNKNQPTDESGAEE